MSDIFEHRQFLWDNDCQKNKQKTNVCACSNPPDVPTHPTVPYQFPRIIYGIYIKLYSLGTGKTTTMIAAILEVVMFSKAKCVLVCSQSNSACDDITKRLMVHVNKSRIIRLYATSYQHNQLDPTIEPISNYRNGKFDYPCLNHLYGYQVVVCTLSAAGSIPRSRGLDPDFSSKHFSHIFIDEAGFVNETLSLVPIAGLYN